MTVMVGRPDQPVSEKSPQQLAGRGVERRIYSKQYQELTAPVIDICKLIRK